MYTFTVYKSLQLERVSEDTIKTLDNHKLTVESVEVC